MKNNTMWDFNKYKENIAVIDESGEAFSYGYLEKYGNDLAARILATNAPNKAGLPSEGLRPLVFCLCSNTLACLIGYTGLINHHIPVLLLDSDIAEDMLSSLIDTYRPTFIYRPLAKDKQTYDIVATNCDNPPKIYKDLALLLTTSGSTGSPKLVRQSYDNLLANTKSIVKYLRLDENERAITTLPMSYTYGLSVINTHLFAGASIVITNFSLMQKEFWRLIADTVPTSLAGVPYTYEMLDRLRFTRMDLPSLRTMTQAGGKLSPELHKKLAKFAQENGKAFIVMYGQTEATARMAYLPADKSLLKYGSMGVAIPGGRLSLLAADGSEIGPAGEVGELVYYGANVALGYAESYMDLAKGDEWQGRLVTGDMAKRDEDGYYYIVGRKKRFLKIFGNRVNLDEIDAILKQEFSQLDMTSGGKDDHLRIYVAKADKGALSPGAGASKEIDINGEAMLSFIASKTGLNRTAFEVVEVEKIPRSESGKVLYKELEA